MFVLLHILNVSGEALQGYTVDREEDEHVFNYLMETRRILDEFAQNLECPVCFELPTEPIYACVVGHLICKRCHGMIKSCPLCRGQLLGTRSFIAEKSVNVVSHFICKFSQQPDIAESSGGEQSQSNRQKFGVGLPVRCSLAVNGCRNKLMDAASYIHHLKAKHTVLVVHSASGSFTHKTSITSSGTILVKRGAERLFIMEVGGRSFIINMCQDGKGVRIWAETEIRPTDPTTNPPAPAVTLSVLDAKNESIVSWSGLVNGLHVTDRSVSLTGNCLKATTDQMKASLQTEELSPSRFWKFSVQIHQNPKPKTQFFQFQLWHLFVAAVMIFFLYEFSMPRKY